jgi:hypothetical protein
MEVVITVVQSKGDRNPNQNAKLKSPLPILETLFIV